jgi:hypothetical protein
MRGSRLRILLGVAMAGVVVGHSLAYFAALPNASARAELLARTGHSYWTGAVLLALALSAVAFARHIRNHVRLPLTEGATGQNHLLVAVWLAAIQVSAYAVIEVTERLASGYPIQQMFHSALPLIGVAVQVLVACASTLLLGLLARAQKHSQARLPGALPRRRHPACGPPAAIPTPSPSVCSGLPAGDGRPRCDRLAANSPR